jgi:ribosomal protein S18 acetylase RimI-like enzyme
VATSWLTPDDPLFADVAVQFDDYRVHYGQQRSPRTREWLADQVASGRLRLAAATGSGAVTGFVTVAEQPASLMLGTTWGIRDLYVAPAGRRQGVARALLDHVVAAARAGQVRRIALQTEPGNDGALALYRQAGFEPITGFVVLSLDLRP